MHEPDKPRLRIVLVTVLAVIVVAGTVDLILDDPESWWAFHPLFEIGLIAGALLTASWLWFGWWRAERDASELRRSLKERKAERDAWRKSARQALQGFAEAIEGQFREWGLTPAEREVGLLLLKGYSHKRVARLTDRSERTARQHAVSVYRKAGLSGRAELQAFFLDDLMLPTRPDDSRSVTEESSEPPLPPNPMPQNRANPQSSGRSSVTDPS